MQKHNILISFILILFVGFFIKVKNTEAKNEKIKSDLNKELMKAKLEIGKARTVFGDTSKYVYKLEKELAKDIKLRNALLTKYGKLKAKYRSLSKKKVSSKVKVIKTLELKECKELKLKEGHLYVFKDKKIGEMDSFEGGFEDHHINITCRVNPRIGSSGTIGMDISYDLELNLKAEILETVSPSGATNNYINIYEIDKEGKELKKLKIDTYSVVVKDERTSKFSLWDPYVDIGIGLGIAAKSSLKDLKLKGIASLGISASSYGLSGKEPLWRFGKASINLSDQV